MCKLCLKISQNDSYAEKCIGRRTAKYMPDWTERRTDTKPMLCGKALCEYVRHRTVGEIVRQCVHVAGNHLGVESFDCERLNGERQVAGQHREHVDAAVQDNTTVSMLTTPFSRHSKTCNHICRKSSLYRLLRPVHFTIMLVVECLPTAHGYEMAAHCPIISCTDAQVLQSTPIYSNLHRFGNFWPPFRCS